MTNTLTQQLQEKAVREFEKLDFTFIEYGSITEDLKEKERLRDFITKLVADVVSETVVLCDYHNEYPLAAKRMHKGDCYICSYLASQPKEVQP